jgi:hypothetical protein
MSSLPLEPRNRSSGGFKLYPKNSLSLWNVSLSRGKSQFLGWCVSTLEITEKLPFSSFNRRYFYLQGMVLSRHPSTHQACRRFIWLVWCLAMFKLYQPLFQKLLNPVGLGLLCLLILHSNPRTFTARELWSFKFFFRVGVLVLFHWGSGINVTRY